MTKNNITLKELLQEEYSVPSSKYNGPYTKSTLFLLPMLNLSIRDKTLSTYLSNVFLNDDEFPNEYKHSLFLLFKVKNLKEDGFVKLTTMLKHSPSFKALFQTDYYVGMKNDEHLIMYVFNLPEDCLEDYYHFINGQYSQMSRAHKAKFPEKVKNSAGILTESIVYGALHKTDYLKNVVAEEFALTKEDVEVLRKQLDSADEIWDKISLSQEIYRFKPI